MAVHFVYRCHYRGPSGKHVAHFPDGSVLAWFQNHWAHLADSGQADNRLEELLGCDVYGFSSLFEKAAEQNLTPPASYDQLDEYLQNYLYVEEMVWCRPHVIQALTDDDDIMMAYFFFDDHFLARHLDRAAYLLTEGWQLPGGAGTGGFVPKTKTERLDLGGKGEGTTYAALMSVFASDHLDYMSPSYRIPGMRLPEFARHLVRATPNDNWPRELLLLRPWSLSSPPGASPTEEAFLMDLRQQKGDFTPWLVYSDWLIDQGQPCADLTLLKRAFQGVARWAPRAVIYKVDRSVLLDPDVEVARAAIEASASRLLLHAYDPKLSCIHVEEHLAQLCLHASHRPVRDEWHQWYFFDDLWASAHPTIAESLLTFDLRWDALSAPRSKALED
jgi:uncharacterized protein (TIGR02996 family)